MKNRFFDGKLELDWLKFTICSANNVLIVKVHEPDFISYERWCILVNNIKEKKFDSIDFYHGNGSGCIEVRDGNIIFSACPSGAGGDFGLKFTTPITSDIVDTFEKLLNDEEFKNLELWKE